MMAAAPKLKSRVRLKVAIIAFSVLLLIAALSFPIGPAGCQGADCFIVGPLVRNFNKPAPGGGTVPASARSQMIVTFPGTVYYTDRSTAPLTAQQTAFAVLTGPNNKPIDKVSVQVVVQINYNYTGGVQPGMTVGFNGYIDEVGSRPASDVYYFRVYAHNVVSFQRTVVAASTSLPIYSSNRTVSDFTSMSDIGSNNNTHFNWALVGALNVTFGTPLNKTVAAIFAWPNSPININYPNAPIGPRPPPPPPGGCRPSACPVAIVTPIGAKYSWYTLDQAPTFTVADAQSSRSILQLLGLA
jgi:hypothetical protein